MVYFLIKKYKLNRYKGSSDIKFYSIKTVIKTMLGKSGLRELGFLKIKSKNIRKNIVDRLPAATGNY